MASDRFTSHPDLQVKANEKTRQINEARETVAKYLAEQEAAGGEPPDTEGPNKGQTRSLWFRFPSVMLVIFAFYSFVFLFAKNPLLLQSVILIPPILAAGLMLYLFGRNLAERIETKVGALSKNKEVEIKLEKQGKTGKIE